MEEQIRQAVGEDVVIRRPPSPQFGDYAVYAGPEKAEATAKTLRKALQEEAAKVDVARGGFVNITLSREAVSFALAEADAQGERWGRNEREKGKRVIIEYSNPNPFKEMHIGHLVGTVVGEALSRLIESEGATVARDTFGGDIGPNVAKALWGLQKMGIKEPTTPQEIGEAYTKGSLAYESDENAKKEIDALNQAIYAGTDHTLMELWRTGRDVSMEEFRRLWRILGTRFDFEFFDSDTTDTARRIVHDGLSQGVFKKSDGAIIYDGEAKGVHTMVFLTSHNTPTYEAKDLGLAFLKEERWPSNESIVVTGNEQAGRFKTVLSALSEIAAPLAGKTNHIATGFLRLTSGKMSSREGNTISANELIQSVMKTASEKNPDPLITELVAIGAVKFMILRQAPGSDILFDAAKSLSLEGDSGPYLQYALVRAKSVLAQAHGKAESPNDAPHEPFLIERIMLHFPEIVARAARTRVPNLLVNYLIELAGEWNAFYGKERIIGGIHEAHKLLVTRALAQTLQNGLALLGIPTLEKM